MPSPVQPEDELNSPSPEPQRTPSPDYQFKLISVGLKEAALDSPSFRATMNHMDSQLMQTEQWYIALTGSFSKITRQISEFSSIFSLLDFLLPEFFHNGPVDQEYTVAALEQTKDGLRKVWISALKVFQINSSKIEDFRVELSRRVTKYTSLRRRFLSTQQKFDQYLSIHMSTPKYKEADLLLEDSLQLAEVRKAYLQASLDLVLELHDLSDYINKAIIDLCYTLWHKRMEGLTSGHYSSEIVVKLWNSIKRIRSWSQSYSTANAKLAESLATAKQNIEEVAIKLARPSASLDDYRPNLINARSLEDTDENAVEKHGYLFMKTTNDNSSKPVWVRRWAFIHNGIFGFLTLSPNQRSVQETDKIGLLLANLKYTPNEDRHFCFELKTKDLTVVLQAETLSELKSWLKVFHNASSRIVDPNDSMHSLLHVASGRFPPLVAEFSSTSPTSTDRSLTSTKIQNNAGQLITSSRLSTHIERNEAFFERYILEKVARIHPPFPTDTTQLSLIAYGLTGATMGPNALSANFSGSLNWGLSYMFTVDSHDDAPLDYSEEVYSKQIGFGIYYPFNYPDAWMAKDLQLRALFESAVGPGECCLVSYSCLFSPNLNQELRGNHFFTQTHVYAYIHSLGFVSMSRVPITRFVEANCQTANTHDVLRFVMISGQLKMKLFMDDGPLVAKKLNILFQNAAGDDPLSIADLITKLLQTEQKHNEEISQEQKALLDNGPKPRVPPQEIVELKDRRNYNFLRNVKLDENLTFLYETKLDLPAHAVLHVLCGSHSSILDMSFGLLSVISCEKNPWMKPTEGTDYLFRENLSISKLSTGKVGKYLVQQSISDYVENELYIIKLKKLGSRMGRGLEADYIHMITLSAIEGERTRIQFHGGVEFRGSSNISFLIRRLCYQFNRSFTGKVMKELKAAMKIIGHRGKTLKAAYYYGKIQVSKEPYTVENTPVVDFNYIDILKVYAHVVFINMVWRVSSLLFIVLSALNSIFRGLTMHRFLLGIIALLSISNVYLAGLSGIHHWQARHSRKLVERMITADPLTFNKAIYSKDVQDMARQNFSVDKDSLCFKEFQNNSVVLNYNRAMRWADPVQGTTSKGTNQRIKDALLEIAMKRHELLVSLEMLKSMEESIAKSEWKTWLMNEMATCDQVVEEGLLQAKGPESNNTSVGVEYFERYCGSCAQELAAFACL